MARVLSDAFKEELLSGYLSILLQRVKNDQTLMLAIREGYINIYYRGGNILKLTAAANQKTYRAEFDKKYCSGLDFTLPECPNSIASKEDMLQWLESFPLRKQIMDFWFTTNPKAEREFQQLIVRENNYSSISNDTEYFIADIELADATERARFDLLAFKWTSKERKADSVRLALIEMKYGDDSLQGKSGVVAH